MARTKPPAGNGPLFEAPPGNPASDADMRPAMPHHAPIRQLGWMPMAMVGGLVAAGLWGAWVTKSVLATHNAPPIARVQLSGLVGEYVQAQARSATPPEQVSAETRAFMAEIQHNLERRGASGQIVLVGEAVLAGNVPDITAELRREVYAHVRMPQPAGSGAADVMGAMRQAMGGAQVPSSTTMSGNAAGGGGNVPGN